MATDHEIGVRIVGWRLICLCSSVVERFFGKEEVVSPILTIGSHGVVLVSTYYGEYQEHGYAAILKLQKKRTDEFDFALAA